MSDEWEDVEREMNQSSGGFYKPARLPKDGSEEITIVRYSKWLETKYPIKDKEGNSLGYTWRFFLQDGRSGMSPTPTASPCCAVCTLAEARPCPRHGLR